MHCWELRGISGLFWSRPLCVRVIESRRTMEYAWVWDVLAGALMLRVSSETLVCCGMQLKLVKT